MPTNNPTLAEAVTNLMCRLDDHFEGTYDWKEQEEVRAALERVQGVGVPQEFDKTKLMIRSRGKLYSYTQLVGFQPITMKEGEVEALQMLCQELAAQLAAPRPTDATLESAIRDLIAETDSWDNTPPWLDEHIRHLETLITTPRPTDIPCSVCGCPPVPSGMFCCCEKDDTSPTDDVCRWEIEEEDSDCWTTGCGKDFVMLEDSKPHDFNFCVHCGKRRLLVISRFTSRVV
jgi:hypothetical protein